MIIILIPICWRWVVGIDYMQENHPNYKGEDLFDEYINYDTIPKVILYIAMSKDGFIAGENDNIDFLNDYQTEGEDYGYFKFIESVGSVVVGRKTYDKVVGMGYPYHLDKEVYVLTKEQKASSENITYYNGDITSLIKKLKSSNSGNTYCDGGAEVAHLLLANNLIDEIILSVIPTKLKKGTLLFKGGKVPTNFEKVNKVEFNSGLTQYTYELKD